MPRFEDLAAEGQALVEVGGAVVGVDVATQAELDGHATDTTDVHGIADTSLLETTAGAQAKADAAEAAANTYTDNATSDTGWRSITPAGSWTGTLQVRRVNDLVVWAGLLTMPASGIVLIDPPAGFEPRSATVPNILGRNGNSGAISAITCTASSLAWGGTLTSGNTLRFEGSYLTDDAWPATLPGTAV